MVDFWANWIEAVRFTCEAQGVISARLMLFASAAPNAAVEVERNLCRRGAGLPASAALRKRQFQPAWPAQH
jgi:hypothetical protein